MAKSCQYFGRTRLGKGFQEMEQIDRPRRLADCHHCGEAIHEDEDGVIEYGQPWHAECWLLQILRKVSPSAGIPEVGQQTVRQAALECVLGFEREGRL